MPTMKPKDLIRLLEKDGWEYVPSNGGSHQKYKKGTQTITIPYHNKDLPTGLFMKIMKITGLKGCFTDGDNLTELMENAYDAIRCHLTDYVKEEIKIPAASRLENVHLTEPNTCLALATADFDPNQFSRSVKKTLTIPAWLNDKALTAHVNFSQVLQDALMRKLNII